MRKSAIALLVVSILSAPAFAAEDVLAGYYGNTIVSTGGGMEIRTHYRADHTFDLVVKMMFMSRAMKGTWTLDEKENICRTVVGDLPPNTPNPTCAPIAPHKVGDT